MAILVFFALLLSKTHFAASTLEDRHRYRFINYGMPRQNDNGNAVPKSVGPTTTTTRPASPKFPVLFAASCALSLGVGALGGFGLFFNLHQSECQGLLESSRTTVFEAASTRVRQELGRDLDQCKFTHQALQAQVESLTRQLETAREDYKGEQTKVSRVEEALRQTNADHAQQLTELREALQREREGRANESSNKAQLHSQVIDTLTEQYEAKEMELKKAQAKLLNMEQEMQHQRTDTSRQVKELQEALQQKESTQKEHHQAGPDKLGHLTSEINRLTRELEGKERMLEELQQQNKAMTSAEASSSNNAAATTTTTNSHEELLALQKVLQTRLLEQTRLKYGTDALQVELTLDLGSSVPLQTIVVHIDRLDVMPMTASTFFYLLEAGLYTGTHLYAGSGGTDSNLLQGGQLPLHDESAARRIFLNHTKRWAAHGYDRDTPLLWADEVSAREAPCPRFGIGMDWYHKKGGDFFILLDLSASSSSSPSSSQRPCFGHVVRGMSLLTAETSGTMAHAKIRAIPKEATVAAAGADFTGEEL